MAYPSAIVLRAGLLCGWYSKEHVARWADEEIARQAAPSYVLIELSMVKSKDEGDLAALLLELSGPFGAPALDRLQLGFVARMLRTGELNLKQAAGLVDELTKPYEDSEWPAPAEIDQIKDMEYTFELIESGVFGPVHLRELGERFRAFMTRFETDLASLSRTP